MFGDEEGVGATCDELGLRHAAHVRRNEYGTPLLDDILEQADKLALAPTLVLVNADIMLTPELPSVLAGVCRELPGSLLIARRWNVSIDGEWDFRDPDWAARLVEIAHTGSLEPIYGGVDLFVYPRGFWGRVPEFSFGRGRWDSGLILLARRMGVPVADVTAGVCVVHQAHDYAHIAGSTPELYDGPEAERNSELLGPAECILTPLNATHVLRAGRISRNVDLRPTHLLRRMATWPALYPVFRPFAPLVRALAPLWRRK